MPEQPEQPVEPDAVEPVEPPAATPEDGPEVEGFSFLPGPATGGLDFKPIKVPPTVKEPTSPPGDTTVVTGKPAQPWNPFPGPA